MNIEYKKVSSKIELLDLIEKLSNEDDSNWENQNAKEFIEALGTWLKDADGFYKNFNLKTDPNTPSWQLFADALEAATIYE